MPDNGKNFQHWGFLLYQLKSCQMKAKQEKFKAVDFMRKQREELSQLHKENPKEFEKQ